MTQAIASYRLNPENAKQVGQPTRINEKGAYIGTFTRAEAVVSRDGTNGIEFTFKASDGRTAEYLTAWTVNADGKEIYGRKVLDALMTCLKVREVTVEPGRVTKYDPETKQDKTFRAQIVPALMNKGIGLLLVREGYEKNDGSIAHRMVIVGAYEAATGKTPREVLENLPAGALDKIIDTLQDREPKRRNARAAAQQTNTGGGFDAMDDDIPF